MKTPEQVDAIMAKIDEDSRYRWCGGERGPCACIGCVQNVCQVQAYEKHFGRKFHGDPEWIRQIAIPAEIRAEFLPSREEWEAWVERHPDTRPPRDYSVTCATSAPITISKRKDTTP